MENEIQELGWKLMEDSREDEEFSAQRGLINELFPFIYEASKRMSSRAISRWLAANDVKLSAVTIAKALRDPKPYWQELLEEMEAPGRIVANAYGLDVNELIGSRELFDHFAQESPTVQAVTREGCEDSLGEIRGATNLLQLKWFSLPETIREACLANADLELEENCSSEAKPKEAGEVTEGLPAGRAAAEDAVKEGPVEGGAAIKSTTQDAISESTYPMKSGEVLDVLVARKSNKKISGSLVRAGEKKK
jgi:hypothetical protein